MAQRLSPETVWAALRTARSAGADAGWIAIGGARELAEGNTRDGVAVLFTVDSPPRLAAAQAVKQSLAKIGLDVRIRGVPLPTYFGRLGARGDYDIGFRPWVPDYSDPFAVLNVNFDGRFIGDSNWGRLDSPGVNRPLREAASLTGPARRRARPPCTPRRVSARRRLCAS